MPVICLQSPFIVNDLFIDKKSPFDPDEIFPLIVLLSDPIEINELKSKGWTELTVYNEGDRLIGDRSLKRKFESHHPVLDTNTFRTSDNILYDNRIWAESKRIPSEIDNVKVDLLPDIEAMKPTDGRFTYYRSPGFLSNSTNPYIVRATALENERILVKMGWKYIKVYNDKADLPDQTKKKSIIHCRSLIVAAHRNQRKFELRCIQDDDMSRSMRKSFGLDPFDNAIPARWADLLNNTKTELIDYGGGLGGGQYVREDIPFLKANALAFKVPYQVFIRIFKKCSGELSEYYLNMLDEDEIKLISS